MKFAEQKPIRCLLEADIDTFKTLANVLFQLGGQIAKAPVVFDDTTKQDFNLLATMIIERTTDHSINYEGKEYQIFQAPRRRFLRADENPIYLGTEYGNNFLDACRNFMRLHPWLLKHYNERKNKYSGRDLISDPALQE
jgi:hypothetical protein